MWRSCHLCKRTAQQGLSPRPMVTLCCMFVLGGGQQTAFRQSPAGQEATDTVRSLSASFQAPLGHRAVIEKASLSSGPGCQHCSDGCSCSLQGWPGETQYCWAVLLPLPMLCQTHQTSSLWAEEMPPGHFCLCFPWTDWQTAQALVQTVWQDIFCRSGARGVFTAALSTFFIHCKPGYESYWPHCSLKLFTCSPAGIH